MLIDQYLPRYDVSEAREVTVDATPDVTYAAIRETNLSDRMIDALFAIRELPAEEPGVAWTSHRRRRGRPKSEDRFMPRLRIRS